MFNLKRKSTRLLAGLSVAALVLILGCGSSSSPSTPPLSGDAKLSALVLTGPAGPLTPTPAFSAAVTSYALTIGGTGPITIKATLNDPSATLTVNGVATQSGVASAPITLSLGANPIPVIAKAPSGTTQAYTITITAISQNASLAALSVQGANGDIVPAFAQSLATYTLRTNYAASPAPVTVRATLADPTATMTVNGTALASNTVSAPIPMTVGTNPISIVVRAQDGLTVQTYAITCRIYPQNTNIRILDSINGTPVAGTLLTVADPAGSVLQAGIPVGFAGTATLGLDGTSKYNLTAQATGSAQSLFASFDSSVETVANFFCHPLGMITFPALAPQITALSFSPDKVTWTPVTGSSTSNTLDRMKYLKVTALGSSNIATTYTSGFGIGINVDQPAWSNAYWKPYVVDEQAVPVTSGSTTLYRSTMEFETPLTNFVPKTNHFLDVVVYDVANNRTEQKVYLNVTDGVPDPSQDDLSTCTPSKFTVQLVTHGLSRSYFSIAPNDTNPVSYDANIAFALVNADKAVQEVTGYEIDRSTDGKLWTKVATKQYSKLDPGTVTSLIPYETTFRFKDTDPTLQLGTTYYYRVRCFNGNTTNNGGYSQYSPTVGSAFLPPFTTRLLAPANQAISSSLTPKLSFYITNAALFDPAVCDYFYFYLSILEMTGAALPYGQHFRYNFADKRFESSTNSAWDVTSSVADASSVVSLDATRTLFTINSPAGFFQNGVTYQWCIFGTHTPVKDSSPARSPSSFQKFAYPYNDARSKDFGMAYSQGSTSDHDYGAVNGYFTLIIDPNAK